MIERRLRPLVLGIPISRKPPSITSCPRNAGCWFSRARFALWRERGVRVDGPQEILYSRPAICSSVAQAGAGLLLRSLL